MAIVKTTIILGDPEEPASSVTTSVQREDLGVMIETGRPGEDSLEIFIHPSLFPAIRSSMEAAETLR